MDEKQLQLMMEIQTKLAALGATPDQVNSVMSKYFSSQVDNPSMLETALADFNSLPPDELKQVLQDLSESYGERRSDLRDELTRNYDTLTSESPQGQMAGNNQFSVYVGANPLEHLASGINKYQAGKGIRSNREDLDKLATREAGAQERVLGAGARAGAAALPPGAVSAALRKLPNETDDQYWVRTGQRPQYGT